MIRKTKSILFRKNWGQKQDGNAADGNAAGGKLEMERNKTRMTRPLFRCFYLFVPQIRPFFFTLPPRKLSSFTTFFFFSSVDAMQIHRARDRSLFAPLENLLSCSPELGISSYCWEQSSRAKKAGGWEKRWGNVATCFSASFLFFISWPLNKGEGRPH